jgi:putative tricarboxylic transport membrane protein
LYPFGLTGDALTAHVRKAVADYGKRASELGLVR